MCWQRRSPKTVYPAGHQHPDHLGRCGPFSGILRTDAGRAAPDAGRGLHYLCTVHPRRYGLRQRKKAGSCPDVLRSVNEQLAQLAASKGCVYLDLWETLADGEGNLKEMIAAPDGVHLSAGQRYGAWVTYLRNHAKYSASNPWIMAARTAQNNQSKGQLHQTMRLSFCGFSGMFLHKTVFSAWKRLSAKKF